MCTPVVWTAVLTLCVFAAEARAAAPGGPASVEPMPVHAGTLADARAAARDTAEAWLALHDAGKHEQTWNELASPVKGRLSPEQWRLSMELAGSGTGSLVSRSFEKSLYSESLPGVPDGSYVVVTYRSRFEKRDETSEIVAVALDTDGRWRVCGYHVRWKAEP